MRLATIITGILMIAMGIWCFANPGATFASLAFLLGVVMLIAGAVGIASYFWRRKFGLESGWQLAEGIVTLVLSILVLANRLVAEVMIPLFFGMWLIFTGTIHVMQGLELYRLKKKGWYWPGGFGLLSLAAGIFTFVNPLVAGITVMMIIGILFVIQGANVLTLGVHMKSKSM